tara:strand:- start:36261 stop:36977 length:717 start_codon:yes stop_codon:yes gene_type:complete
LTKALILCAGEGQRLRPLTLRTPKPLIKVNGQPLLAYWLNKLTNAGVKKILINTHYMKDEIINYVNNSEFKKNVVFVEEQNLLGTAGTLINNSKFFFEEEKFIFMHGDNYSDEDISKLLTAHENRPEGSLMTMMTFNARKPEKCGIVELTNNNIVCNFYEKSKLKKGNIANSAIYVLSSVFLKEILENFENAKDFSLDILPNFLGKIYTFHTQGIFYDIGTPEDLEELGKILKKKNIN